MNRSVLPNWSAALALSLGLALRSAAAVAISAAPASALVQPGAGLSFTATVTGATNTAVTWAVSEAAGGTITTAGRYQAPATTGTFHVVATSVADPTRAAVVAVQVAAQAIIPPDRLTTWNPGQNSVGGIPIRSTVYRILSPSGNNDTAAIQSAVDTCPPNQVVLLSPGTFIIAGNGISIRRPNITLRGAGPTRTLLNKTDELGTSPPNAPVLVIGPAGTRHTVARSLTADALKGSSTIVVSDSSGLKVGELITLNQISDEMRSDSVPPVRKIRWGYAYTDPTAGDRRWYCQQNRPAGQTVEIQAINGSQLTLTTPLHFDFEVALQAHIVRFSDEAHPTGDVDQNWSGLWTETFDAVKYTGIEDLAVANGGGSTGSTGNLGIFASAYCWIKNIESWGSIGPSCLVSNSLRCEVRDSYFHSTRNPTPGGEGYAMVLGTYASDNLYENNVVWNFNKMTVCWGSGGGNVYGYNYMQDGYIDYTRDLVEVGCGANHYAGNHMELFEGNESFNYSTESKFGGPVFITVFRNHFTGLRISAPPLQLLDAWSRRMMSVDGLAWWHSFAGNVLGFPGMPLLSGVDFHQSDYDQTQFIYQTDDGWLSDFTRKVSEVPVWNIGKESESDYATNHLNPLALARTYRHGNFDYATNTMVWDPGTPAHTLPASLYLSSRPAFFGNLPWPWVTPENAPATTATLPAKIRFLRIHNATATTYAAWRKLNFEGNDFTNAAVSGPTADPDRSGVTNLQRYAFGLDARGPIPPPTNPGTASSGGQSYLTLTFPRRAVASDLSYIVEGSSDLVTWTPVPGQTYAPGTPASVTARDSVALGTAGVTRRFLRVRVTTP